MDNQFDKYDLGNEELTELLSSDEIDREEKDELIKAFTDSLTDNPLGDEKAVDYQLLFNTISINYVDMKLTELRSAKNPSQDDDEKALGYCGRLRVLISYYTSEGKPLPQIKNLHPEKYESEINKRREKAAELIALLETDSKINSLLIQAKKHPDKDTCYEISTLLETLKIQIKECKKHGVSIPKLHCNNPKEIAKTAEKLKNIADKRDDLYQLMIKLDDEISDIDTSGNYDKQGIEKITSLCEQQNKYIYQCSLNNYPLPNLKNIQPSDLIAKYRLYSAMFDLDAEISSLLASANTINQYQTIVDRCDRQDENFKICICQKWVIPPLVNNDIKRIRENYINKIQSIRFSKAAQSNALVETDHKINNLLLQAKEYPEIEVCNEILTQLQLLNNQIENCRNNNIAIPQLYCYDTKRIVETVNQLKKIAEKRDALYRVMQETDDKITEINYSGDYNKQSLKLIKSLCEQQNNNILQCRSNGYPLPELKNEHPSDSISQHKHYTNMVEIDNRITTELSSANTIIQHKKTLDNCDKQAENIEICLKKNWSLPVLANSNIQQVKETVQGKIKAKEKKYKLRLGIIGAAVVVALAVTLIIVFTVKSHEGKSVFPFDSAYAKGQNVELIQKELTDAGFTNIILDPDKSGWTKDGTVLELRENYKKGTYYESNSDIHIKYSCEGRIEVSDILKNWQTKKYTDVVSALKSAGFNGINTEKTVIQNDDKKYLTSGLELNGIEYLSGECYLPASAPIKVSYYVFQLKIGIPSSETKDRNYKELAEELKQKGFSNITVERADDMYHGFLNIGSWGKTEGKVKEFSIGGETEFSEDDSFDFDDEIIITVHTYEDEDYEGITSKE